MKKNTVFFSMLSVTIISFALFEMLRELQGEKELIERIKRYNVYSSKTNEYSIVTNPKISQETFRVHPDSKIFKEVKKLSADAKDKIEIKYIRSAQVLSTADKKDTIVVESEIYYENSRIPVLIVNPYNGSVSTINAFSKTTFSQLPLGEECWSAPSEQFKKRATNAKLLVADNEVLLRLSLVKQPNSPSSRDPSWRNVSVDDLSKFEFMARLALSKAYMAIHDFDNLKKESATIRKVKVDTKRTSDKTLLVPIKSLAKQLHWKYEEKYGVLTLNIGKNKIIIPAGSRELIMGSRKEKLPLPVILGGKEFWVEKNALLRLIQ